jgi:hypothetical protein
MAFADSRRQKSTLQERACLELRLCRSRSAVCAKKAIALFWTMFFIAIIWSHGLIQSMAMPFRR